jgi:hypothetical protein
MKRILAVLATLWWAYSAAVVGGHYGWWPSPVKSGTHILLQNLAFLTFVIGCVLLAIIAFAFLSRKTPRRSLSVDGYPSTPTRDELDKMTARQVELDQQRKQTEAELRAEQDKMYRKE